MPSQRTCPHCNAPIGPRAIQCLPCYHRAYYQAHRESALANAREYGAKHREARISYAKAYYRARTLVASAYMRKYYRDHRDSRRAYNKAYGHAHQLEKNENKHRWKARRRANFVETVKPQIVYQRDQGICGICGQHVRLVQMSLDHILPLSKGGEHSYQNVQLAHRHCNSRRRASGPAQFRLFG